MKKIATILLALATGSAVQSSEFDDLKTSSQNITEQIDRAIKLVGSAQHYAHHGDGLSDGTLSKTTHINQQQLQAYNDALVNMVNFKPYGDVKAVLEDRAAEELNLMNNAVETFTEVVVDMVQVVEVSEISEAAASPQEQAEVQTFVAENQESLTITQDHVNTFNDATDEIELRANNASAFIAVAQNADAVGFLQQGAENNNTTAEQANLSYSSNNQWVKMQWAGTSNASAVYLNGQSYGLDLYKNEVEILLAGTESEFYLTGPTSEGYQCFVNGVCE